MSQSKQFRVVISGGGVAGLTLANALEKAKIDYVLLERRCEISALVGASISIAPNGWRILDQLGLLDDLSKQSQPCKWVYERNSKGELLAPRSDAIHLGGVIRTGYPLAFLDRQQLVQTLYDHLENKSNVLINKNVIATEHSSDAVRIICDDGTSYDGHIVVGADGVSSKIREEMWRVASQTDAALISTEMKALTTSYRALFGISTAVINQEPGDFDWGYHRSQSSLVYAGPHGKTYYFMFEKLDQVLPWGKVPHYTKQEATDYAKKWTNWQIRPDITFHDVFQQSTSYGLAALEEGKFKTWSWGRIACLGDSIHKMTINIGTGGNTAIESVAAFTNELRIALDNCNGDLPTEDQIRKCFEAYQKRREDRAGFITDIAGEVMRLQAMEGPHHRFVAGYCLPYLGDFAANSMCDGLVNAEILEFLPVPQKSLQGTMPFNPEQGECRRESTLKRVLIAIPFLIIFYVALLAMDPSSVMPHVTKMVENGTVAWDYDSAPIRFSFYKITALDDFWIPINVFFTPTIYGYDPTSRQQAQTFLSDYGVVISIWTFESLRRANVMTLSQLPVIFTLVAQLVGIGVVSPVYYFFHYISTPIERFKATDMRLTILNRSLTILPSMLIVYYIPLFCMFHWPTFSGRESWLFFWQMSPVWTFLTGLFLSYFIPNTTATDRIKAPKRDIPVMQYTIGTLSTISAFVWIWVNITSSYNFTDVFVPKAAASSSFDFMTFIREFLKIDEISLFGTTFIWLGYLFWDMKHAGMIESGWFIIITSAITGIMIVGPGATAGLGWLWREHAITNKRHKAAITKEHQKGLQKLKR